MDSKYQTLETLLRHKASIKNAHEQFHPATRILVDSRNLVPIKTGERIHVTNQTILETKKEENDLAFQSYVRALKRTKEFIKDISESGSFMKLIRSHEAIYIYSWNTIAQISDY
ncbi:4452_t:CDS:2 [Diversispora eburnea]|uniref:4452_t:CDS:1 n=1 Tax=Diversispora eburnea TaxID=1213867 RepID=A0A9N9AZA4_9GLOM|nr:4452_t:CDS:2 [Diversispora eburnea]